MHKLRIAALIALTALSTLAISEGVRRAVAQQPSTACEEEVADAQDEIAECLEKATTLQQAKACADM
jgi:hypothetical protein